jgi:hypothetical protein
MEWKNESTPPTAAAAKTTEKTKTCAPPPPTAAPTLFSPHALHSLTHLLSPSPSSLLGNNTGSGAVWIMRRRSARRRRASPTSALRLPRSSLVGAATAPKHHSITASNSASMVHVTSVTPRSDNPSKAYGQTHRLMQSKHQLLTTGMVRVTNLCQPYRVGSRRSCTRRSATRWGSAG